MGDRDDGGQAEFVDHRGEVADLLGEAVVVGVGFVRRPETQKGSAPTLKFPEFIAVFAITAAVTHRQIAGLARFPPLQCLRSGQRRFFPRRGFATSAAVSGSVNTAKNAVAVSMSPSTVRSPDAAAAATETR